MVSTHYYDYKTGVKIVAVDQNNNATYSNMMISLEELLKAE